MTKARASTLKFNWLLWIAATVLLVLYGEAARLESTPTALRLQLTPGTEAELDTFRLFENPLRMVLTFRADGCDQRPELGSWQGAKEQDGVLRLKPGATVRIEARQDEDKPVVFEAMPMSGYCNGNSRGMTANLAQSPGVYRWPPPPETPILWLHTGMNRVRLKVTEVEPPIAGEAVTLTAPGALGIKIAADNVAWLVFGLFLKPVFLFTQGGWLLGLLVISWIFWRRPAEEEEEPDAEPPP